MQSAEPGAANVDPSGTAHKTAGTQQTGTGVVRWRPMPGFEKGLHLKIELLAG